MALRFVLDRHVHLAGVVHARAWLTMREQFGLAPNTLDAYARAVDSYVAFLQKRGCGCEASTRADIGGWINESRTRGLADATPIQRITALRLFFECENWTPHSRLNWPLRRRQSSLHSNRIGIS